MVTKQYKPDWKLFLVTLALLSFGVVMVFDASYALAIDVYGDKAYFFKKQAMWAVLGLAGMAWACKIRYWKLKSFAIPLLLLSFIMLVIVHKFGHSGLGAQRWIGYGPVRIQPSEFAKLAIVLFMARMLAEYPKLIHKWVGLLALFGTAGGLIFLVERQPDLGTAVSMLLTVFAMLYVAGAPRLRLAGLLAVCCVLGCLAIAFTAGSSNGYRFKRLTAFVNPNADPLDSGYQIIHSTLALGTGGWDGVGFGESREKWSGYLPAQQTDFIFAIIGEEFGLIGTGLVLIGFLLLAARGFHIAHRTRDPFGAHIATGITAMITVQALLNIGVVSASIPATGVPLPFISYGGSALVSTLFGIGILLNVSQYPHRKDMRPSARRERGEDDHALEPPPAPRSAGRTTDRVLR